mmetsp:Transcript_31338/g.78581  ORF Transcript_31338/g.78581 Transcript_31338/m.78581 type:complete len:213 (+) Transcript_31338:3395-4033(+)
MSANGKEARAPSGVDTSARSHMADGIQSDPTRADVQTFTSSTSPPKPPAPLKTTLTGPEAGNAAIVMASDDAATFPSIHADAAAPFTTSAMWCQSPTDTSTPAPAPNVTVDPTEEEVPRRCPLAWTANPTPAPPTLRTIPLPLSPAAGRTHAAIVKAPPIAARSSAGIATEDAPPPVRTAASSLYVAVGALVPPASICVGDDEMPPSLDAPR